MKRRVFLIGSAMMALASAIASCFRKAPPPDEKPAQAQLAAKKPAQPALPERYRPVLRALVARLYPELAVTAKATDYIEQELLRANMQGVRRTITNGCVQLERIAMGQLKNGFANLAPVDQDLVITAVQSGDGAPKSFHGDDFIAAAVAMTIEGVFSDPVYGGNAGEVGWKSIGWVMQTPRPTKP